MHDQKIKLISENMRMEKKKSGRVCQVSASHSVSIIVVGEIAGYRLYVSVRCQRTQARSHPLSSLRAKATAASSGGGGGSW